MARSAGALRLARTPETMTVEGVPADLYRDRNDIMKRQAKAMERQADALEKLAPAAETVHGFAARLDALCKWFKSAWPWMVGIGVVLGSKVVQVAPDAIQRAASLTLEYLK